MGNRKNRHNVSEIRVIKSQNSDLSGYDKMFMFQIESVGNIVDDTPRLQIVDFFGNKDGINTEELQFNWEFNIEGSDEKFAFDHNGNPINSINDAYAAPAVVTSIDTGTLPLSFELTGNLSTVYIKGQFGSLYYFDVAANSPSWGADVDEAGNFGTDEFLLTIKQWGNINVIKDWERFGKAQSGNALKIAAIDEPNFAQGVSLYRAFEDTTVALFTADASASVESWDSNKFGNGQRIFENGFDQPNIDKWSFKGADMAYAFYMRTNMTSINNGGDNMIPNSIAGFAGYASESFSDTFQNAQNASTGIHNWEKLNTSLVEDAQYFAWENTRSKSLGTMKNLDFSRCKNFTAMFGKAGEDADGAVGELLIDPSNWDMKAAETCFYMFGIEAGWSLLPNVATVGDLPTSGVATGDAYKVNADGEYYVATVVPADFITTFVDTVVWNIDTDYSGPFVVSDNTSSWNGELNWKTMKNCIDIHSIVKNRSSYTGPRLDEFAPISGQVVLFRSAFAGTAINYDFSNWNFSGVDATRSDITYNENNSSGIMGGFVRDCQNMSLENLVKLLEACDRPFGQGGLPVSGVDAQIGTSVPNSFEFGSSYQANFDNGVYVGADLISRGAAAKASLISKGYTMGGLDFLV